MRAACRRRRASRRPGRASSSSGPTAWIPRSSRRPPSAGWTSSTPRAPSSPARSRPPPNSRPTGTRVVIVGEADHPEVEGIVAHTGGDAIVVEEVSDIPEHLPSRRVRHRRADDPVARAAQPGRSRPDAAGERAQGPQHHLFGDGQAPEQRGGARSVGRRDGRRRRSQLRQHHAAGRDLSRREPAGPPRRDRRRASSPSGSRASVRVGVTAGASTPDEQMAGVVSAIEAMVDDVSD